MSQGHRQRERAGGSGCQSFDRVFLCTLHQVDSTLPRADWRNFLAAGTLKHSHNKFKPVFARSVKLWFREAVQTFTRGFLWWLMSEHDCVSSRGHPSAQGKNLRLQFRVADLALARTETIDKCSTAFRISPFQI